MKRHASHMSLFITKTIVFFAFCSTTINDVWTMTTAREMKRARESKIKKMMKKALPAM